MIAPVRLVGPRVECRLAAPDEAGLVVDFVTRNRDHLGPWEPEAPPLFFAEAFWRERLGLLSVEHAHGHSTRVHIFPREARAPVVIGTIGLTNIVRGASWSAQVGFGLDAQAEGRGLMREALSLVIAYAFEERRLHRLEAHHQPQNLRSAGLLRRLGFVPYGYSRDYVYLHGAWRDHVHTALVAPNWTPPDA